MGLIEKALSGFGYERHERHERLNETVEKAEDEEVGRIIAPVFREIPPESKAGKFLTEGFRSWAYIAVSAIADEISTNPLNLYTKGKDGWVKIESGAVVDLIEKPNSYQTKEEFFWLASVFWMTEGEAPIYLNSPKNPTEMVLLNPENLSIIFDEKNIIGGYKYRQKGGTEIKIDASQLIMLKMPSVHSPFRGSGITRYIAQTLDIDNYIEEYLKMFFYNDTTPGAVLETEQTLNPTIINRLRQQFTARHSGYHNSHKLSILEKGLKYHKISSNINELQMKEMNDLIRDKVLATFRVPKSVLGIVEDVNRANAEASDYTFSKRAILPRLKMIEAQLNQFLLPKMAGGDKMWLEYETPVFEDKKQNAEIYALGIQNGWMTVDEVRDQLGLDPIDMVEEENPEVGKYAKPKETRKKSKKRPDGLVEIMKGIIESENKTKKEWTTTELEAFHDEKIMFTDALEKTFIEKLDKNFRKQERYILDLIKGKSKATKDGVNLELDFEAEVAEMIKLASPILAEAVVTESGLAFALLGVQDTLSSRDEAVKKYIEEYSLKLGESTTKTTQEAVDRIVKRNLESEGSWTDLRNSLKDYFEAEGDTGARARANLIARTEISRSAGFAQVTVYEQTGAVGKKWLTAKDEKVCPVCSAMDGMIIPVRDNYFSVGDSLPDGTKNLYSPVGTPPVHPACVTEDMLVSSPDARNIQRMNYSGEIVKITLSNGSFITVTPNHPIFTNRGFVMAKSLNKGDGILVERISGINPDSDCSPATVGEVFDTLQKTSGVSTTSVPVSSEDFHGDGKFGNGDIDIVSSDSLLRDKLEGLGKQFNRFNFNGRLVADELFPGESDFASMLLALAYASDGVVSLGDITKVLGSAPGAHHEAISFLLSSGYNSRLDKAFSDSPSINSESLADFILGLSEKIGFSDVLDIEIETRHDIHVYDISTTSTVYSTNGVITSNCRCDLIPVYEESKMNGEEYHKAFEAVANEKAKKEAEAEKLNTEKKSLEEKEASLKEAEVKMTEEMEETKKLKAEAKKAKKKAEDELKEIEAFKNSL